MSKVVQKISSRSQHACKCRLASPLLLLLLAILLPTSSLCQLTFGNAPITTITPSPSSDPSRSSTISPTTTHSTKLTPSSSSILVTTPPDDGDSSPLDNNNNTPSNPQNASDLPSSSIVNYYFLLLALLVIVLGALLWTYHRRRKRKIARSRDGGRDALRQDLEGWNAGTGTAIGTSTGPRRWMPAGVGVGWRGMMGLGGSGAAGPRRAAEGLDERGEAPPPYEASRAPAGRGGGGEGLGGGRTGGSEGEENRAIPLQTITIPATGQDGKPPEYRSG